MKQIGGTAVGDCKVIPPRETALGLGVSATLGCFGGNRRYISKTASTGPSMEPLQMNPPSDTEYRVGAKSRHRAGRRQVKPDQERKSTLRQKDHQLHTGLGSQRRNMSQRGARGFERFELL